MGLQSEVQRHYIESQQKMQNEVQKQTQERGTAGYPVATGVAAPMSAVPMTMPMGAPTPGMHVPMPTSSFLTPTAGYGMVPSDSYGMVPATYGMVPTTYGIMPGMPVPSAVQIPHGPRG